MTTWREAEKRMRTSNSHSTSSSSSSGIGACGLLGVAFVVLKLMGVINWSWWWVTCPFWIGLAIVIAVIVVALGYFLWRALKGEEPQ
jgi:hypothetical protein